MKKLLLGTAAIFVLAACSKGPSEVTVVAATPPPSSGIELAHMNTSVRPGDDFFSYVNGKWIEENEIPADKATYGGFVLLRDAAEENINTIIQASATGDFAKGTDEQKVGDLYKSYLNMDLRNTKGVAPLEKEFKRIDGIKNYDELAVYFGSAIKRGLDAPFVLGQYADMKNPKYYMIYTWQSGLGLPDREFYFNKDEKSVDIRNKYVSHVEKMFDIAGLANGADAAKTIMALETEMAAAHMKKEDARDFAKNYSKISLDKLGELMPDFNWTGYIKETGIGDIDGLVVMMNDHMSQLDKIILKHDLGVWKTWLKWSALNNSASRLNAALDEQNFQFYGKTLTGTEEQREPWRRAVGTVNGALGEVVGKVYVKDYFPPEAKERMLELVGNLIKAYEVSIKDLAWMTDETRAEALDKLSKFRTKVGYPDEWRDYSALDIEADDLYGNIERANIADYERNLARQGGPVDRNEWGMTPQTVNAYYSPALNEIVFPAAILQPPFFTMDADEAVNYGAIGAVIGHEIGHGFDDKGSTFDGDGVLRNWWTDEDRAEFDKRTSALVAQYDSYAPFEDLNVNGTYTLGENIGDLGGIGIGLLAYKISLNGKEGPVIDGFTGVQRVFLGFGQIWRNKYRDEALRQQIQTNSHSPSMYRANGSVRNVSEFYDAFDVKETDALYLPPEERVKIW